MPKHILVSPDEDLATFYGGGGRTHIPEDPAFAMEIDDPESEEDGLPGAPPSPPPLAAPAVAAPPPSATAPPPPPPSAPAAPRPPSVVTPPPLPSSPPPPGAPVSTSLTPYGGPGPILAAVLSFFLPGLGQILAGQTTKGVVLLLIALCTGCGGGLFNIVLALDAYAIAKRRQNGEPVTDWQFF